MSDRPQPLPDSIADQERWEESALRARLLDGMWEDDALEHEVRFFHEDLRQFLPAPELSRNPFLSIHEQLASLYDDPADVAVEGEHDLSPILTEELWSACQERNLRTEALNEYLVRYDLDANKEVVYRLVEPHLVANAKPYAKPTRALVGQPAALEELRYRPETGEYYWEIWDLTDENAPRYRIDEIDADGRRIPGEEQDWEHKDSTGKPLFPYVLYHKRGGGGRLFTAFRGGELVCGTLTSAALGTMWVGGVRDGAHPQRFGVDVEPETGATLQKDGQTGSIRQVVANPLTVIFFRSKGDKQGQLSQFQPALDPKTAGEAIEAFMAGLAVYAGVSPSDITLGSNNRSGYAIVVSRDGQRRARKRQAIPARRGDRLLFSRAAALYNAAHPGSDLPERPEDYRIRYAEIKLSPGELLSMVESVVKQVEAGLLNPVDGVLRLNPDWTREEAVAYLNDVAASKALLSAAARPPGDLGAELEAIAKAREQMREVDYIAHLQRLGLLPRELEPAAYLAELEKERQAKADAEAAAAALTSGGAVQDLALNGAQVSSLREVLADVAAGTLTADAAVAVIAAAFPSVPELLAQRMVAGAQKPPSPPDTPAREPAETEKPDPAEEPDEAAA